MLREEAAVVPTAEPVPPELEPDRLRTDGAGGRPSGLDSSDGLVEYEAAGIVSGLNVPARPLGRGFDAIGHGEEGRLPRRREAQNRDRRHFASFRLSCPG